MVPRADNGGSGVGDSLCVPRVAPEWPQQPRACGCQGVGDLLQLLGVMPCCQVLAFLQRAKGTLGHAVAYAYSASNGLVAALAQGASLQLPCGCPNMPGPQGRQTRAVGQMLLSAQSHATAWVAADGVSVS
jgi:hypothetical protein